MPVVQGDAIPTVDKGVSLVSQKEGEKIFNDLCGSSLFTPCGQVAILTPKKLDSAGDKSQAIHVRVENPAGRFDIMEKWITNLGNKDVRTMIEKKSQRAEAKLPLVDMTMKVVAVLAKRFVTQQDYENARKSPAPTFDQWLKKHDLSSKG